jgi:N-acyl-D-aspartate/D-glutamate deacylase
MPFDVLIRGGTLTDGPGAPGRPADVETAVAKLGSVPAARIGLADQGQLRVGWKADVVGFDPVTVADAATFDGPAVDPIGIRDVIGNGRVAVRDGEETGERPGGLLRRGA